MDRSYPYTRRVVQRTRLRRRVAIVAAAGVASCAIAYGAMRPATLGAPEQSAAVASVSAVKRASDATSQAARRVYPYSIVPGGVSGAADLARVIRKDRVVAAHYATFDVARAEKKTVATPRAVHMSYRKGDKVYWTARKLMLAEGETLLSDGSHEVRARCANRISDTPQFPVEAHAPSAAELDSSVLEDGPAQGGMDTVSMGMPEDHGAARPGGFLNAPGTGGAASVGGSAGSTASGSLSSTGGQPLLSPVSLGRLPGAGTSSASSSTGTRPAPGTSSPDGVTDSPAQPTPESSAGPAPDSPGMVDGPAAPPPSLSTPPLPTQPDGTPPFPPPGPIATPVQDVTVPAPGLGLPGVVATPLPGDLSGGGDSIVDTPGARGELPVPAPTLTPPILPAQPVKDAVTPTQIPEPGTLWLAGTLLAGLLARRRTPPRLR